MEFVLYCTVHKVGIHHPHHLSVRRCLRTPYWRHIDRVTNLGVSDINTSDEGVNSAWTAGVNARYERPWIDLRVLSFSIPPSPSTILSAPFPLIHPLCSLLPWTPAKFPKNTEDNLKFQEPVCRCKITQALSSPLSLFSSPCVISHFFYPFVPTGQTSYSYSWHNVGTVQSRISSRLHRAGSTSSGSFYLLSYSPHISKSVFLPKHSPTVQNIP